MKIARAIMILHKKGGMSVRFITAFIMQQSSVYSIQVLATTTHNTLTFLPEFQREGVSSLDSVNAHLQKIDETFGSVQRIHISNR